MVDLMDITAFGLGWVDTYVRVHVVYIFNFCFV